MIKITFLEMINDKNHVSIQLKRIAFCNISSLKKYKKPLFVLYLQMFYDSSHSFKKLGKLKFASIKTKCF